MASPGSRLPSGQSKHGWQLRVAMPRAIWNRLPFAVCSLHLRAAKGAARAGRSGAVSLLWLSRGPVTHARRTSLRGIRCELATQRTRGARDPRLTGSEPRGRGWEGSARGQGGTDAAQVCTECQPGHVAADREADGHQWPPPLEHVLSGPGRGTIARLPSRGGWGGGRCLRASLHVARTPAWG